MAAAPANNAYFNMNQLLQPGIAAPVGKRDMAWQLGTPWRWRLLLVLLSCALAARGQQSDPDKQLYLLHTSWQLRLENTYKYQLAVLPIGCTSVERYLQLGGKQYLLEYAVDNRRADQQLRQDYMVRIVNQDTVRLAQAQYMGGGATTREGVQGSLAAGSAYLNDSYFDTYNLLLSQTFDPLAVLALRPGAAQTGQWLVARATPPGERGDTVASYSLVRSRTGDTCQVQLLERTSRQRPWRHAKRVACRWTVELARQRLTAEQQYATREDGYTLYWERLYHTATDFTETLTSQMLIGDGGPPSLETTTHYCREFVQRTAGKSVEKFTVFDRSTGTKAVLTFQIISLYR
jgi:hypothetical protein